MQICTFTITTYGTSGNELPPPAESSFVRSIISGNEGAEQFRHRMQEEGMVIRRMLAVRFEEKPKPYSCADSCDWSITEAGSIAGIVTEILRRDALSAAQGTEK